MWTAALRTDGHVASGRYNVTGKWNIAYWREEKENGEERDVSYDIPNRVNEIVHRGANATIPVNIRH